MKYRIVVEGEYLIALSECFKSPPKIGGVSRGLSAVALAKAEGGGLGRDDVPCPPLEIGYWKLEICLPPFPLSACISAASEFEPVHNPSGVVSTILTEPVPVTVPHVTVNVLVVEAVVIAWFKLESVSDL